MKHPSYMTEAEKIIRYQANQIASGKNTAHASKLNDMYENYYDGQK